MKNFTPRATVFLILAAIGIAVALYSAIIRNYILLIAAVLFALVSADNIFCSLRENGRNN